MVDDAPSNLPKRVDLREFFLVLQEELMTKLRGNRQVIQHPTTKGTATELNWIGMLDTHLPKRYAVKSAQVVDVHGNCSDQIDIVVFDCHYCPLLFHRDGALYIPAESVYAVLEVKQDLDKAHIEYAGKKAASVRSLRRTSAPIPHAGGTNPPKTPIPIQAGLLCLGSTWQPALDHPFETAICSLPENERLDFVCALEHGAVEIVYRDDGPPQFETSAPETALVFFFVRFLQRLQQVGTVGAIDLKEWAEGL